MTQPAPGPTPQPAHPAHPRRWTPQRQKVFLLALQATRCVAQAADLAGMSRQSAYRLLRRKPDSAFAAAWRAALDWRSLPPPGPRAAPAPGDGR